MPVGRFKGKSAFKRIRGIEGDAELNQADRFGLTAFHTAILTQHLPEAEAILKQGADPFVADRAGKSALDFLADFGQADTLERFVQLLKSEQKLGRHDDLAELTQRAKVNQMELASYARHYAPLNPEQKQAALYTLAKSDYLAGAEAETTLRTMALLQEGANAMALDDKGNMPLYYSVQKGHHGMVMGMLYKGADVNQVDAHGNTLLHEASRRNDQQYGFIALALRRQCACFESQRQFPLDFGFLFQLWLGG